MKGSDLFSILVPLVFCFLIGAWVFFLSRCGLGPILAGLLGVPAGWASGMALIFALAKVGNRE